MVTEMLSNVQDIDVYRMLFSAALLKEDVSITSLYFSKILFGIITTQSSVNNSSLSQDSHSRIVC